MRNVSYQTVLFNSWWLLPPFLLLSMLIGFAIGSVYGESLITWWNS